MRFLHRTLLALRWNILPLRSERVRSVARCSLLRIALPHFVQVAPCTRTESCVSFTGRFSRCDGTFCRSDLSGFAPLQGARCFGSHSPISSRSLRALEPNHAFPSPDASRAAMEHSAAQI